LTQALNLETPRRNGTYRCNRVSIRSASTKLGTVDAITAFVGSQRWSLEQEVYDMSELHQHRTALKRGNARQRRLRDVHSKREEQVERMAKRQDDVFQQHVGRVRETKNASSNPFRRFAQAVSTAAGRPWTFMAAVVLIVVWGVSGPMFSFSDTWQLVINTTTTIVTFLMVFLIQNTQNRDTEALRLKLDELILATRAARNEFVKIEDLDDDDLDHLEKSLKAGRQRGGADDDSDDD
jgi:low affinity Fe/Cu permease